MVSARLQGQIILNTRPAHQQAELTQMLQRDGARVLSFPVIEIEPVTPGDNQRQLQHPISDYDILLFVSRNAVDGAFQLVDTTRLHPATQLGVIGAATSAALRLALADSPVNVDDCLVAGEPYNSEALLQALARLNVTGKHVLIFRGQQGRNLLGDELQRRGAVIEYAEVYRRTLPADGARVYDKLLSSGLPTLVILTSTEGMQNLLELVDAESAQALCRIPWLLISERMRESALKLGHNAAVLIAQNASDKGIRQTIRDWTEPA
jgi:uroporphyrinogen-III synthase